MNQFAVVATRLRASSPCAERHSRARRLAVQAIRARRRTGQRKAQERSLGVLQDQCRREEERQEAIIQAQREKPANSPFQALGEYLESLYLLLENTSFATEEEEAGGLDRDRITTFLHSG